MSPPANAFPCARKAMERMSAAMVPQAGAVPQAIAGVVVNPGHWELIGDEFLLRGEGFAFHYSRTGGLVLESGPEASATHIGLFLHGTVYAAVACLNGLYPIHASAVAYEGGVHAFTGPSGAGKSTLVTALGAMGLPMFCDDTLLLELSDPDEPLALPGHKRLKLSAEALALTGAKGREQVSGDIAKFYADPPGGDWDSPLPLRALTWLEGGDELAVEPITGARKIAQLTDDHYTFEIHEKASRLPAAQRFALQARLARAVRMARLVRPFDTASFDDSAALAYRLVCSQGMQP